ncbi:MAG: DUF2442 domain-containing protein [Cyanobacteriota bacterium]|nr:DUF2442 domain-containing protein [Cyanobacteriota bacterium]
MINPASLDEEALKRKIEQAREAAEIANKTKPRASSANYDRDTNEIVIQLKSGAIYRFPVDIAQGLAGASPEDLAEVEVTPSGDGLHWEKLDADFSVPGLLAGIFGTKAWMERLQDR